MGRPFLVAIISRGTFLNCRRRPADGPSRHSISSPAVLTELFPAAHWCSMPAAISTAPLQVAEPLATERFSNSVIPHPVGPNRPSTRLRGARMESIPTGLSLWMLQAICTARQMKAGARAVRCAPTKAVAEPSSGFPGDRHGLSPHCSRSWEIAVPIHQAELFLTPQET